MPEWDQGRLISASELERWSYCPLSWKLERMDSSEDEGPLRNGVTRHREIGKEAMSVIKAQSGLRDSMSITWTYLLFSILLLMMGVSLVVLTRVGSMRIDIWRIGVVVISLLLLLVSLTIYFSRPMSRSNKKEWVFSGQISELVSSKAKSFSTSVIFYLYGLFLLVNGIVLLRPFGMDYRIISSVIAVALAVLYVFLLISVTITFSRRRAEEKKGDVPLGALLVLGLVISLSVLFILLSDRIDTKGLFGWVFLSLALVWFITAIIYDRFISARGKKERGKGSVDSDSGLPIASLALMASVFTASTFLAKGDNLEEYYIMSIVIAALWLVGAVFFFWRGNTHRKTASDAKRKLDLPESSRMIDADDLERKGSKPLVSGKHFLVGTPDMIIEENGIKIPVEVKTGRVPPKPHFSHIMQIGAYLVLMDINYHQETPYGYIEYAPGSETSKRFRIEWDMMTKALVLSKVSEVREAERTKVVHRNHNREGKCRNCSRRSGCPERLDRDQIRRT
ncbi:MAG: hypothetical protein U9R75_05525 [Candidatus Thermoplasmatota archaeon]|nr:hypothetical protein [Candidatus Thermoplasmatota archaeon]